MNSWNVPGLSQLVMSFCNFSNLCGRIFRVLRQLSCTNKAINLSQDSVFTFMSISIVSTLLSPCHIVAPLDVRMILELFTMSKEYWSFHRFPTEDSLGVSLVDYKDSRFCSDHFESSRMLYQQFFPMVKKEAPIIFWKVDPRQSKKRGKNKQISSTCN